MEGRYLNRPDDRPPTGTEGTAALKFPSDPGSSPVPNTFSSGSSPTLVDFGSDAPTLVDGTAAAGLRIIHPADLNLQTFLRVGAILGRRYEILQLLGEGGMGSVYRARDREVNRVVALKVIRPELTGNPAILPPAGFAGTSRRPALARRPPARDAGGMAASHERD